MVNETRIQRHIDRFVKETGLSVSPMARHLIVVSLDAIERDPNPSWDASMETLESYADEIASNVPSLLNRMAESTSFKHEITYFNVLHFLSRNLKDICPFPSE